MMLIQLYPGCFIKLTVIVQLLYYIYTTTTTTLEYILYYILSSINVNLCFLYSFVTDFLLHFHVINSIFYFYIFECYVLFHSFLVFFFLSFFSFILAATSGRIEIEKIAAIYFPEIQVRVFNHCYSQHWLE